MIGERKYQRTHLRAPYKTDILFADKDFVFKAHTVNISEGGLLLDQIPFFPEGDNVPLMMAFAQFPYFKNFSLERLNNFTSTLYPAKVIRGICRVVRKEGVSTTAEVVMQARFGVKFIYIDPKAQSVIADYVDVFASNLIYLQILLDAINDSEETLHKVRKLSQILGYSSEIKIAQLRQDVERDYLSLQWL